MARIDNIFTKFYPHLDLHGETAATCVAPLLEFINDNIRLKNSKVVVIHGKGEGILKMKVHEVLKQHRNVSQYNLDAWNQGETIVVLEIDK